MDKFTEDRKFWVDSVEMIPDNLVPLTIQTLERRHYTFKYAYIAHIEERPATKLELPGGAKAAMIRDIRHTLVFSKFCVKAPEKLTPAMIGKWAEKDHG